MLKVESIQNGVVIDHITEGQGMNIYQLLHLEDQKQSVALLQSVRSQKYGHKDLIKIEGDTMPERLDILGYLDDKITLIVIQDGAVFVREADCGNQDCVQQGAMSLDNYTQRFLGNLILCLPHKLEIQLMQNP